MTHISSFFPQKFAAFSIVFFTVFALSVETLAQDSVSAGRNEIVVNGVRMGSLQQAFDTVRENGYVLIGPGVFRQSGVLKTNGVTIVGSPGTWLDGVAADGKAAMTINGRNISVDSVNCRNIAVSSNNGACIRQEGGTLLVKNVEFRDSQQGILSNGNSESLIVEDSIFDNLGKAGRAHALYISGGRLEVRRTKIINSVDQGHGIKSRTKITIIERNLIASGPGDDSRLIDISNGGRTEIRDNVLIQGVNSVNWSLVGFAMEGKRHPNSTLMMERNVSVSDRKGGGVFLQIGSNVPSVDIRKNIFIGNFQYTKAIKKWPDGNYYYKTREEFGLPPAPQIPEVTLR